MGSLRIRAKQMDGLTASGDAGARLELKAPCQRLMKDGVHLVQTNDDVVDGDEDELHEETDEAHDRKANRCRHGDLAELSAIGLCAALDEAHAIACKLSRG
eukprot:CAMPEP_0185155198 /NCGR_PEP_ID=MMETSP1139-20130426/281_1 /TAXON_ID=298111 /ORGANISM="Pavlova sp., Strain CCMP459" /LENGTH=100 /DNA_ID=CAMNT_0027720085 /DNA_START=615 /DNA_END=913 /DNA_ORIENTATION=-